MFDALGTPAYDELLTRLLDDQLPGMVAPVVTAVQQDLVAQGVLQVRIDSLLAEAARLAEAGETLNPSNPVLRALIEDVTRQSQGYAALLSGRSGVITREGLEAAKLFTEMTTVGLSDDVALMARFNSTDPRALEAYYQRLTGDPLRAELDRFVEDVAGVIDPLRNGALRAFIQGKNPLAVARRLRDLVENYPLYRLNTLMRTLQMNAFRQAQAELQKQNRDILSHQIRIAALDGRTCLACVAAHGTRLAVGEPVLDHPNGRCTAIAVVKGREAPTMVRYTPDGRRVGANTGEEWFKALTPAQQEELVRSVASGAAWRAIQSGEIGLPAFVGQGATELFGPHIYQRSLKEILGDRAGDFYE